MSTIKYLRDMAATLPDGDLKKALTWAELELGERADHIFELEDDIASQSREIDALRLSLHSVKRDLELVASAVHGALFEMPPPAVDRAPHINIMAAHGVMPYAKTKNKPRSAA